jgi:hypothetical protein
VTWHGSRNSSGIAASRERTRLQRPCRIPIVYWNTIYTQHALDELPHDLAGDELAGLTPTLFEHVNPLATYTFDTDRPAGQLRPLRAASAA